MNVESGVRHVRLNVGHATLEAADVSYHQLLQLCDVYAIDMMGS